MRLNISAFQMRVYLTICRYTARYGRPPSLGHLARHFDLPPQQLQHHTQRLIEARYLINNEGRFCPIYHEE